ncbi:MAG TPA: FAD-dependent oxidoreductase, partial [Burkholderiales bacterium]|nr:FAD-dependent oxidoreductase [Burkholderiales bacterium]
VKRTFADHPVQTVSNRAYETLDSMTQVTAPKGTDQHKEDHMDSDSGANKSIWMQTADVDPIPVFESDEEADVCIVGAGIAGLTTAYCLAREGRSVIVLDDGPIGGGETSRTTAHLVNALDDCYHELESLHGKDGARLAAESHTAAIDEIERIVAEIDIKCDFLRLDGYLFAAEEDDAEMLSRELQLPRSPLVKGPFCDEAQARSPSTAMRKGGYIIYRRSAPTSVASSNGMIRKRPGIVPVTVRGSTKPTGTY